MAIIETTRPVPSSAIAAFRVVQYFERKLETLRTWLKARRTERALHSLPDHILTDIGLIRSEIETVSHRMAMR